VTGGGGLARKALLIGINNYPAPYKLRDAINNEIVWRDTLRKKAFTSFRFLSNNLATRSNILGAMDALVRSAKATDQLAIVVSSHGSYAPDQDGDETDGRDEGVVSVDMQLIRDDEIRAILDRLPQGSTADLFFDCCYSGTATKSKESDQRIPKFIPPYALRSIPKKVAQPPRKSPAPMNHCLWAACKDNEQAFQVCVDGTYWGAFSLYCAAAVRSANSRAYDIEYTQRMVARLGIPQTPQLECDPQDATKQPFS
jgi:hypothetical protein